jgi:hypothetical protein
MHKVALAFVVAGWSVLGSGTHAAGKQTGPVFPVGSVPADDLVGLRSAQVHGMNREFMSSSMKKDCICHVFRGL